MNITKLQETDNGHTVIEKIECEFKQDRRNDKSIPTDSKQPEHFHKIKNQRLNSIIQAVAHFFGLIECDNKVPERWKDSFKPDMSPSN